MDKNTTLNLRINPEVKREAEVVLSALGLSMTAAINIYLKQIALRGAIPFELSLPPAPNGVNADLMTKDELIAAIDLGLRDIAQGRVTEADAFFSQYRRKLQDDRI
ncbi:MAG: type II toxin-antitoxin system RelB/DinJ family antitoxin [Selenomonadaceae bacterium]|nr:type II toxin-antitoxin system RelB/DinJ family antitoxin [Selenomonadaceae bacterium]